MRVCKYVCGYEYVNIYMYIGMCVYGYICVIESLAYIHFIALYRLADVSPTTVMGTGWIIYLGKVVSFDVLPSQCGATVERKTRDREFPGS